MFVVVKLQDLVQIEPADMEKPSIQAIEDNINAKYANKVIAKTGLCICLLDVVRTTEGVVATGTGTINVNVEFRMIVFRPFRGELIDGVIVHCDPQGITLSIDFFEDIWVPAELLFEGTEWRQSENVFVWKTEWGTELFFDLQETVRFRVESERWNDVAPTAPKANEEEDDETEVTPPYQVVGSMMQTGLGPQLWWAGEEEDEEQPAEDADMVDGAA